MKRVKILTAFAIIAATVHVQAQSTWIPDGIGGFTTTTSGSCNVQGGLLDLTIPTDPLGVWRSVKGGTASGGLSILANTLGSTDGPVISLHGISYPPLSTGEIRAGSVYYNSFYNSLPSVAGNYSQTGHRFLSYDANPGVGGWHTNMEIGNDGRTIVGPDVYHSFIAPGDALTVRDQLGFYSSSPRIHGNAPNSALTLNANTGWDGSTIEMWGGNGIRPGQLSYYSYTSPGHPNYYGHMFLNYDPSGTPGVNDFMAHMCINKDGKVVIGNELIYSYSTTSPAPGNYLLYVQKGILTEKLKVALTGTSYWSDFVFDDSYDLMPLNKVESYIKANKHLPQIPSADEVVAEGIDVATMDAKLLQKIEELTLYVIQLQKEVEVLKAKNSK